MSGARQVMQHCLGSANYYRQLNEVGRAKRLCLGLQQKVFLTTSGPNYFFSSYPGQVSVSFVPHHFHSIADISFQGKAMTDFFGSRDVQTKTPSGQIKR